MSLSSASAIALSGDKSIILYDEFNTKLKEDLKFMDYVLPIYVSAKTGLRTEKILSLVNKALENSRRRITSGKLNELILDSVMANEPPSVNGKRLKINYATQAQTTPPTFVFFVNDQTLMHFSYKRYLENCIRNAFDFSGTPISLVIREKNDVE